MPAWNNNPNSYWLAGSSFDIWAETHGLPITEDAPEMVWVDLETTGLDSDLNVTLEMGILLTNKFGEVCRDGAIDWRLWRSGVYDDKSYKLEFDNLDPVVDLMHINSGLKADMTRAIQGPYLELMDPHYVEREAIDWLRGRTPDGKKFPMSGSSAHFDRGFVKADLPKLNDWFHYRVGVDASGLREIAKLLNPAVVASQPVPLKKHRPLPDLADSVRLYRHLLQNFLVINLESM